MRFTGSSSFLPERVRGTASTATIPSGMWRGESWERRAVAIRFRSPSSRDNPGAKTTNNSSSPEVPARSSKCTTKLSVTSSRPSTTE